MVKFNNVLVHEGKCQRFIETLTLKGFSVGLWNKQFVSVFDSFNAFQPDFMFLESQHIDRAVLKLQGQKNCRFVVQLPKYKDFSKSQLENCKKLKDGKPSAIFILDSSNERNQYKETHLHPYVVPHGINSTDLKFDTPRPNPALTDDTVYIGDYNPAYDDEYKQILDGSVAIYGKGWKTPFAKGVLSRTEVFNVLYNANEVINDFAENTDIPYIAFAVGCAVYSSRWIDDVPFESEETVHDSWFYTPWNNTYEVRLANIFDAFYFNEENEEVAEQLLSVIGRLQ